MDEKRDCRYGENTNSCLSQRMECSRKNVCKLLYYNKVGSVSYLILLDSIISILQKNNLKFFITNKTSLLHYTVNLLYYVETIIYYLVYRAVSKGVDNIK